jgi:hypothetical protein
MIMLKSRSEIKEAARKARAERLAMLRQKREAEALKKPYKLRNKRFYVKHAGLLAALTERNCLVSVQSHVSELGGLGEENKYTTQLTVVLPAIVNLDKEIHNLAAVHGLKMVETVVRPYGIQLVYA